MDQQLSIKILSSGTVYKISYITFVLNFVQIWEGHVETCPVYLFHQLLDYLYQLDSVPVHLYLKPPTVYSY